MVSREEAKGQIKRLIEVFKDNIEQYKQSKLLKSLTQLKLFNFFN